MVHKKYLFIVASEWCEDMGGISGYAHFLEAWRKRSHPEHQQMRQWVGKHFQPELFLVQQVNAGLALFISLSSKS
jgi:Plasmid pRiA4b ORF-3-like protein